MESEESEELHTTRANSPTGRRYRELERRSLEVLLFARRRRQSRSGRSLPYVFLGAADYEGHEGERPMRVRWRLRHSMPPDLFRIARAVAG